MRLVWCEHGSRFTGFTPPAGVNHPSLVCNSNSEGGQVSPTSLSAMSGVAASHREQWPREGMGNQMFLDYNSHQPCPMAMLAVPDGMRTSTTSGGVPGSSSLS